MWQAGALAVDGFLHLGAEPDIVGVGLLLCLELGDDGVKKGVHGVDCPAYSRFGPIPWGKRGYRGGTPAVARRASATVGNVRKPAPALEAAR